MTAGFWGDSSVAMLPLNDVQKCKCVQGTAVTWMRRLTISVIQRPHPVESHGQGLGGALSLPVQTNRGIPAQSARMTAGFENALSLHWWNQRGGFFGRLRSL